MRREGGFGEGPYRDNPLTHRVLQSAPPPSRTFISLVRALETDPRRLPMWVPETPEPPPAFRPAGFRRSAVFPRVGAADGSRKGLVNANASDLLPLRKWDGRDYVELARRILAKFAGSCVGFTGPPEEAPEVEKLAREVSSPRCFCIAGRTTMRELVGPPMAWRRCL